MILRPAAAAPGYTTVSLAAALDVTRTFTVFGRLDNLFDRRYQNPVGFLQPAFGVFAGIRASYSAGERVALRPVLSGRGPTPAQYVKCPRPPLPAVGAGNSRRQSDILRS